MCAETLIPQGDKSDGYTKRKASVYIGCLVLFIILADLMLYLT